MSRSTSNILLYLFLWLLALLVSNAFFIGFEIDGNLKSSLDFSCSDFVFEGLFLAVFLGISLVCNHFCLKWLRPLQHYRHKIIVYGVAMLVVNTAAAVVVLQTADAIWGESPNNEWTKTLYLLAFLATFVSGLQANVEFQQSYQAEAEKRHKLELENARQREVNLQTSLMMLQNQVDPHFLFNNFSLLADLIDEDTAEAQTFLRHLSRVYRYKLVHMNQDLVSVDAELTMLRSYFQLITTRYGEAIQLVLPNDAALARIAHHCLPPLSLQLLVENAIKHNVHSLSQPLIISITIDDNALCVSNPLRPLVSKLESTGIGLQNLCERYRLISQQLPRVAKDDATFSVHLPLLSSANATV